MAISSGIVLSNPIKSLAKTEEDLPLLDDNIIRNRIIFKDYSVFRPDKENGDIFYPTWFVPQRNIFLPFLSSLF